MKKIILGLLFLQLQSFAQVKSGKIIYNVLFQKWDNSGSSFIKESLENAEKDAKQMKMTMLFNNSEMQFTLNDYMPVEKNQSEMSLAFMDVSKFYYRESKSDSILSIEELDGFGKILVKTKQNINWKITNKTKKIDNFVCYLATSSYPSEYMGKPTTFPINAWFCPAIPFGYGPKGYGNLPGLILELQIRTVTFVAKKITLNTNNDITINPPINLKVMTSEELNDYFEKNEE